MANSPLMVKMHPDVLLAYRKLGLQVGRVMEQGRDYGFRDFVIPYILLDELKTMNKLWQELQVIVANNPLIDQPANFYGKDK